MKRNRIFLIFNFLSIFLAFFLLAFVSSKTVNAAGNALSQGTTTPRPGSGTTISNPDGSQIAVPDTPVTVNNPDGSEYDSSHIINAYGSGGSVPVESRADLALTTAYSSVGISFIDGNLALLAVPNFDFGSNILDGKTRFVALANDASASVGDASNGAFMDSVSATGNKTLRDPSKYRALVVSDSRLPVDSDGKYNGWKVSAQMTVVNKTSNKLSGDNYNGHDSDVNPDAGADSSGNPISFAAAIEFGNGFGQSGYTIGNFGEADTNSSNSSIPISHPATYYNSDPYIQGNVDGVATSETSTWTRVDSPSSDVPDDNQSSGALAGLFFPRLSKTPSPGNINKLKDISGTAGTANNNSVTTIPMGPSPNVIWGYMQSQQDNANNTVHPDTVSNGAWALDFKDQGSAIMALPKAVMLNRPGTYVYNLTWTLSSGFIANP